MKNKNKIGYFNLKINQKAQNEYFPQHRQLPKQALVRLKQVRVDIEQE